jgi:hypothetical protein
MHSRLTQVEKRNLKTSTRSTIGGHYIEYSAGLLNGKYIELDTVQSE